MTNVDDPTLIIILKSDAQRQVRLPLYVRDLPGMLAPSPDSVGVRSPAESRPESEPAADDGADASPVEVEIDPFTLKDLTHFRAFLAKLAEGGKPVHLWCWDARFERLLQITGAPADATEIEIDLTTG